MTKKKLHEDEAEVVPTREKDAIPPTGDISNERVFADNKDAIEQVPLWQRDENGNFPTTGSVQVKVVRDFWVNGQKYPTGGRYILPVELACQYAPCLEAPVKSGK